jgi:ankyrin repeat protein
MQANNDEDDINRLTSEQIAQFFDDIKSGNLFAVKDAVNSNPAYLTCRTEDEWEYTAAHWASQKGYPDIVSFLLTKGADFHLEAKKVPWKPILLAARYGHKTIVEMFLDAGEEIDVQINCDSKYTPLHCTNLYTTKNLFFTRCMPSRPRRYCKIIVGASKLHLFSKRTWTSTNTHRSK